MPEICPAPRPYDGVDPRLDPDPSIAFWCRNITGGPYWCHNSSLYYQGLCLEPCLFSLSLSCSISEGRRCAFRHSSAFSKLPLRS